MKTYRELANAFYRDTFGEDMAALTFDRLDSEGVCDMATLDAFRDTDPGFLSAGEYDALEYAFYARRQERHPASSSDRGEGAA